MKITFGKPTYDISLGIWTGIVIGVSGDSPVPPVPPTPTGNTETYAILDSLSKAKALLPNNHWDWVYCSLEGKWYRYNNLSTYEEYGIYADGIDPISVVKMLELDSTYVDTGYLVNANTKIEMLVSWDTTKLKFAGGIFTNSAKDCGVFRDTDGTLSMWIGSNQASTPYKITNKQKYKLVIDIPNGSISIDDVTYLAGKSMTYSSYTFWLANCNGTYTTNWTAGKVEFDYCKIYESGELVKNFSPEVDDDGNACFKELVSNTYFYAKAQSGAKSNTTTTGVSTYNGKYAIVDDAEYQYKGTAGWTSVGTASVNNPVLSDISNFSVWTSVGDYVIYSAKSTSASLKYIMTDDMSEYTLYVGLSKTNYGNYYISASTLNGTDVQFSTGLTTNQVTTFYPVKYTDVHSGDVVTITYSGTYGYNWGNGYTYAPKAIELSKEYSDVKPETYRIYNSVSAFSADTTKYGTCVVYFKDTDTYKTYSYSGTTGDVSDDYFIHYSGTGKFTLFNSPGYCATNFNYDNGTGVFIFSSEVKNIYDAALQNNSKLTDIQFPNSLISIGNRSFYNCSNLDIDLVLDNNIESVGKQAFMESSIKSLTTGSKFKSMGTEAFRNCKSLTTVDLSQSKLTTIPNYAFNGSSMSTVVLPNTLTSLGSWVFELSSLETINLPSAIMQLPQETFCYCRSMQEVNFPYVQSMGDSCFQGCTALKKVTLNSFVGGGSGNWFYQCTALEEVNFGSSYTGTSRNNQFFQAPVKKLTFVDAGSITNPTSLPLFATLETLRVPNLQIDLNISSCTAMTADALVQVFNDLATIDGKTLTIGETNLAKLTDEQIAIATAKGWTVS